VYIRFPLIANYDNQKMKSLENFSRGFREIFGRSPLVIPALPLILGYYFAMIIYKILSEVVGGIREGFATCPYNPTLNSKGRKVGMDASETAYLYMLATGIALSSMLDH
jgi:hypothetical protein